MRFQPYLEGEKVSLVTDHAALQWVKTYENANKRLSAWGTVFSSYQPDLEIIHRPGRIHSNVDPLSRLPREPPTHISPTNDKSSLLQTNATEGEKAEAEVASKPAERVSFMAFCLADMLEEELVMNQAEANTRWTHRKKRKAKPVEDVLPGLPTSPLEGTSAVENDTASTQGDGGPLLTLTVHGNCGKQHIDHHQYTLR